MVGRASPRKPSAMRHFLLEQTNNHQISTERISLTFMILQFNLYYTAQFPFYCDNCKFFFLSFSFFNRTIIISLQKETEKFLYCEQILQSSKAHEAWGAIGMTSYSFQYSTINEDTQVVPFIPSPLISSLFQFIHLKVVQFNGTNPMPCCKAKVSHQTAATSREMLVVRTYLVTSQHCSSKSSNRCGPFSLPPPPYIVFFSLMTHS